MGIRSKGRTLGTQASFQHQGETPQASAAEEEQSAAASEMKSDRRRYETRKINGQEHKLCRGPTHLRPEWVPVTDFYPRSTRRDRAASQCKRCALWLTYHQRRGHPPTAIIGWLPYKDYEFAVIELERRLGKREAARRCNISYGTWWKWRKGYTAQIQRISAVKLVNTLSEVRKNNEVRHRDSILHGAKARGKPEKVPKVREDYYHARVTGTETEYKRRKRARGEAA